MSHFGPDDCVYGVGKAKNVGIVRVIPDEDGAVIGLTFNDNLKVTEVDKDGQCYDKVHPGDQLVAVNGRPVEDIMGSEGSVEKELHEHIREIAQSDVKHGPIFLSFNVLVDAKFRQLLMQGFEVEKHHSAPVARCMPSAKRILYTNSEVQVLIIGKRKGESTRKLFSLHEITDVARVGPTSFEIRTKGAASIKLSVQTESSCRLMVAKLHALVILTHSQHDNRNLMNAHSEEIVGHGPAQVVEY